MPCDLFTIAAAHGMTGAQCVLSDCYEKGLGVATNQALAALWFDRAQKSCTYAHQLALWYQRGDGVVDKDETKAPFWFQVSMEKEGNLASAGALAECYLKGRGVARDPAKAFALYKQCAEGGWSFGMAGVGGCYEKGIGTQTNLTEAAKWYIKAAESDQDFWDGGRALVKAGDCYAKGLGVKKDYAQAKAWYEKAVKRRCSAEARRRLAELEAEER